MKHWVVKAQTGVKNWLIPRIAVGLITLLPNCLVYTKALPKRNCFGTLQGFQYTHYVP
jgi:hypothetical protein